MAQVATNSAKAWVLAARPKTLTGALLPVLPATALAYSDHCFHWLTALCCALFACGMQIAANLVNDYYDYRKGTDRADRLGPERACASGWVTIPAIKKAIALVIALSCLAGFGVLWAEYPNLPYGGWEFVACGAVCVIFCFLYTTHLSYLGWGDALVLVFFGLVPVCGTYYAQAHTLNMEVLAVALACGLVCDVMLVINNYRDREQDMLSGKQTLIVRGGAALGRQLYLWLGILAAILVLYLVDAGKLSVPGYILSVGIYLVLHLYTWRCMLRIGQGRALNRILGMNSRNMLLFAVLLSAAIVVHSLLR